MLIADIVLSRTMLINLFKESGVNIQGKANFFNTSFLLKDRIEISNYKEVKIENHKKKSNYNFNYYCLIITFLYSI